MSLFQYYKDKAGEWRWRLRANNNEIIAASGEGYKNKQDCLHAVDLIRTLSPVAEIRIYTGKDEYYVHSQDESAPEEIVTEELVPDEATVEQPEFREAEAFAPPPREPEKKKSRWVLWAILIILLLALLIFFLCPGSEKESMQPVDEPAQQEEAQPSTPQEQAVTPSPLAEPRDLTPKDRPTRTGLAATSHTVSPGDNLWKLAGRFYQDNYLWPVIFAENTGQISNPDVLTLGVTLDVPGFEGIPPNFTAADNSKIATSHVQAYLAYKNLGNEKARNHLWVANRYDSGILNKFADQIDSADLENATR